MTNISYERNLSFSKNIYSRRRTSARKTEICPKTAKVESLGQKQPFGALKLQFVSQRMKSPPKQKNQCYPPFFTSQFFGTFSGRFGLHLGKKVFKMS